MSLKPNNYLRAFIAARVIGGFILFGLDRRRWGARCRQQGAAALRQAGGGAAAGHIYYGLALAANGARSDRGCDRDL